MQQKSRKAFYEIHPPGTEVKVTALDDGSIQVIVIKNIELPNHVDETPELFVAS